MKQLSTQSAALTAAAIATGMTFIDATALNQALPAIGDALHASPSQLMWVVGGYAVALAALLLPAGAAADRLGRRRTLAVGIALFTIASALCAAASSAPLLIAARMAQGIGGGIVVPGSLAVLTAMYPPGERGRAIGVWSAWCAAATVAGPLLGGVLAQAGWWRAIFLINIPLAMVALAALGRLAGDATPTAPKLHRLIPAALWRRSPARAAVGAAFLLNVALYGLLLVLPLALIAGAGYRADVAAVAQLPLVGLLIAACPLAGKWVDRRGPRAPVCAGCSLAMAGLAYLAINGLAPAGQGYATALLPPLAMLGAGAGLSIVPLSTTIMHAVDEQSLGGAAAVNALVARLASAVAIGLFGGLLLGGNVSLTPASANPITTWPATFTTAATVAATLCGLAAIIGIRVGIARR